MTTPETMTPDQLLAAFHHERAKRESAEASEATMLATLTAAQEASTRDLDGIRAARRELKAGRVLLDAATEKIAALIDSTRALREVELTARVLLMVAGDDTTWLEETGARCVTDLRAALAAYAEASPTSIDMRITTTAPTNSKPTRDGSCCYREDLLKTLHRYVGGREGESTEAAVIRAMGGVSAHGPAAHGASPTVGQAAVAPLLAICDEMDGAPGRADVTLPRAVFDALKEYVDALVAGGGRSTAFRLAYEMARAAKGSA